MTLALATPSASAAPTTEPAKRSPAPSRLHTFAMGDTLASIATQYATTIATLRSLNPGRDLDTLKPGDRLVVPSAAAHPLPKLNSPDPQASTDAQDEQARELAAMASGTGNFLSNNPDSDAAAAMARGLATREASSQAQQWLSRFGTARVQIDVDDKFSLKNSQVELLAPLHDTPEQLLFTQGSVHRKDDRQQTTLGLGVRRFNDGYMLGANSFLDYDLSRQHARLGLGVEYWRDFLKVNANSYTRLTGWKDSPDVEDYQERPANGWDLRTEAWLPSMPQLGGKLSYEQYYGDEVGLFGKDNRKKDPSAVTVGLTYTPIPLLTLSADQRKGNGGNETTVGAEFSYQIGEPWAKQVDPAGVGALRTLAGSRYDLVERKNHIVLEYRKKQVIQMAAAAYVSGQGGETKSLSVWVNSKYPLSHIDWTAPALLQAGGRLVHDGGPHYSVVLPDYQTQQTNVYTLHGVAADSKGNRSGRSETRVTVNAPAVSARHSTLTPAHTVLPADGKTQQTLTLAIRDEQQQPVDIALADIQIAVAETQTRAGGIVVSKPERVSAGNYEVRVTAGSAPQSITLTPSVQGTALSQAQVSTVSSVPDDGKSAFAADRSSLPADDKTHAVLTFTAQDANGAPVEGIAKHLKFAVHSDKGSASPPDVTVSPIVESAQGRYTATFKGKLVGRYTVTPQLGGKPIGRLNAEVELQALRPVPSTSKLEAKPDIIPANGSDPSTLTFVAKDINGNPVTGLGNRLAVNATNSSGLPPAPDELTLEPIQESGNTGIYVTTVRGLQADTYTFVPTIGRQPVNGLSATVQLKALPPALGRSTFEAAPPRIPASGTDPSTLTFTARDANDKPVGGLADQLKFELANGPAPGITLGDISEAKTGEYRATLQGTIPGHYIFIPHYNGAPFGTLKADVELLPLPPAASHSKFQIKPDTIKANLKEFSTLNFTAKDINDKPVSGLADALTFIVRDASNQPLPPEGFKLDPVQETVEGNYRTTLKTKIPGDLTITPRVENDSMDSLTAELTVLTLLPSEAHSTITLSNSKIFADDVHQAAITFDVRNELDQSIADLLDRVSFLVTDSAGKPTSDVRLSAVTSTAKGYQVQLQGPKVGRYEVVPRLDGINMNSLKRPIELMSTEIVALNAGRPRHRFPVSTGFPTTAHLEASFVVELANGADPVDYTWTSTASWLTPSSNGYFEFTAQPSDTDSGTITITGARKGSAVTHRYTFKVSNWFHMAHDYMEPWKDAMKICSSLGLVQVSKAEATKGDNVRALGTPTSEWGYMQINWLTYEVWLPDAAGPGMRWMLTPQYAGFPVGGTQTRPDHWFRGTICRQPIK
ncbi:inverse autotransporter beta domain-containing protein [Pseudomonas guariconensis]|uniref:inverse autotransporter beta domain-containing protein n=1 Tax=Pseudomonas guariconensis TaxID=1288410 RepID=UPI003F8DD5F3